jgi:hypothetical protein
MKTDRTWKLLAALLAAALFYAADGLHRLAGGRPGFTSAAQAQIVGHGMTMDAEDVLITSSADGRRLYLWTFGPWNLNERRIPQFKGSVCMDD